MKADDRPVVYTTGIGRVRVCSRCGAPEGTCRCHERRESSSERPGMPRDGIVRIARDKKGRGGKVVSIITGLPDDEDLLASLAQRLKKLCGSGGTVRAGVIEIQGDHRDRLEATLSALGYKVKRAGG